MYQWTQYPESHYSNTKSEAYKFLFENLYFWPRKASRSLHFKNLPKIFNSAIKVEAPRSVITKHENPTVTGIKKEPAELGVASQTAPSKNGLHQNMEIDYNAERLKLWAQDHQDNFSDVDLLKKLKNDDCELSYDQISMADWSPWIVLDNEKDDDIFIASEGYLNNSYCVDFTYNLDNPDSTEYVRDAPAQNYVKNVEVENQTRKDTRVLVDQFPKWSKTDGILKWHSDAKKKRCKSKSNSFALGRTCFRGMSNYYKNKFETVLKSWEKDTDTNDKGTMESLVIQFIKSEFEFNDDFYNSPKFAQFLDCMFTILHSQNYKKTDAYITKRDFKIIRNLLYCYSSHAKRAFIENKDYAMIYSNFYIKGSEILIQQKTSNKYVGFSDELREELWDTYGAAWQTVSN